MGWAVTDSARCQRFSAARAQVTGLSEYGLNFVGPGLKRFADRAQQQAAGHAEFEVDELGDEAALHQGT